VERLENSRFRDRAVLDHFELIARPAIELKPTQPEDASVSTRFAQASLEIVFWQ
jgi:hypothetical protein